MNQRDALDGLAHRRLSEDACCAFDLGKLGHEGKRVA
jgi:hypothetical protein